MLLKVRNPNAEQRSHRACWQIQADIVQPDQEFLGTYGKLALPGVYLPIIHILGNYTSNILIGLRTEEKL